MLPDFLALARSRLPLGVLWDQFSAREGVAWYNNGSANNNGANTHARGNQALAPSGVCGAAR